MNLSTNIRDAVAAYYGIPRNVFVSPNRDRHVAWPRQIAMALTREMTNLSLPLIGAKYGRDHTTVLHALRRVSARCIDDSNTVECMEIVRMAVTEPDFREQFNTARSIGAFARLMAGRA